MRSSLSRQRSGSEVDPLPRPPAPFAPGRASTLLSLQRSAGNRAAARLVAAAPAVQRDRKDDIVEEVGTDVRFIELELAGSGNDRWDASPESIGAQDGPMGGSPAVSWSSQAGVKGSAPSIVRSIAGPGAPSATRDSVTEISGGVRDAGTNTIERIKTKALAYVRSDVTRLRAEGFHGTIYVLIRAHSRGAVAATQVVSELMGTRFPGKVKIELAAHDPVPGPNQPSAYQAVDLLAPGRAQNPLVGPERKAGEVKAARSSHELSNLGQSPPELAGATVVYSVASGYSVGFTPQAVFGADRLIVSQQEHGAGTRHGFLYQGKKYYGSSLNSLPPGIYVAASAVKGRKDVETSAEPITRAGDAAMMRQLIKSILDASAAWTRDYDRLDIIDATIRDTLALQGLLTPA